MPLQTGKGCTTKKCKRDCVSANIQELKAHGTRPRSHAQIVAIALDSCGMSRKKK